MRENRLRTLWRADQAAVNGWLAIPSAFSAEVMAHQGWDSLTIDMQHGVIDYQAMVGMLQAISATPTVPVVRVPWLEPGILMKALDAGAAAPRWDRISTPGADPSSFRPWLYWPGVTLGVLAYVLVERRRVPWRPRARPD